MVRVLSRLTATLSKAPHQGSVKRTETHSLHATNCSSTITMYGFVHVLQVLMILHCDKAGDSGGRSLPCTSVIFKHVVKEILQLSHFVSVPFERMCVASARVLILRVVVRDNH